MNGWMDGWTVTGLDSSSSATRHSPRRTRVHRQAGRADSQTVSQRKEAKEAPRVARSGLLQPDWTGPLQIAHAHQPDETKTLGPLKSSASTAYPCSGGAAPSAVSGRRHIHSYLSIEPLLCALLSWRGVSHAWPEDSIIDYCCTHH